MVVARVEASAVARWGRGRRRGRRRRWRRRGGDGGGEGGGGEGGGGEVAEKVAVRGR